MNNENTPSCCIDCPYHQVLPDPDPHDWFCDDDIKVKCTLSAARGSGYHAKEPFITVACRPYRIYKECPVPDWCPLRKKD